ncbi:hypothetical protein XACLG97_10940004 [Xanthomonas citri pv. citri]|nr:hypothetical protein XACLG97_10940004 [Xanthomonas citri pv. citri]CEH51892.1 hypothetical protein XACG102_4660005 [Xanthomonas citri pv. citri]
MCVASARRDGGGAGAQGLSVFPLRRIPQTQWGAMGQYRFPMAAGVGWCETGAMFS